jgi:hypothetical protein
MAELVERSQSPKAQAVRLEAPQATVAGQVEALPGQRVAEAQAEQQA